MSQLEFRLLISLIVQLNTNQDKVISSRHSINLLCLQWKNIYIPLLTIVQLLQTIHTLY